jgi:hypothetical protein
MKMSKTVQQKAAVEYVARHEHDHCQIYTTSDCRVFPMPWGPGTVAVQVWVMVTEKDLSQMASKVDW